MTTMTTTAKVNQATAATLTLQRPRAQVHKSIKNSVQTIFALFKRLKMTQYQLSILGSINTST